MEIDILKKKIYLFLNIAFVFLVVLLVSLFNNNLYGNFYYYSIVVFSIIILNLILVKVFNLIFSTNDKINKKILKSLLIALINCISIAVVNDLLDITNNNNTLSLTIFIVLLFLMNLILDNLLNKFLSFSK